MRSAIGLGLLVASSLLVCYEGRAQSSHTTRWSWAGSQEKRSGRTAGSAQSEMLWVSTKYSKGFNSITFGEYMVTGNRPVLFRADSAVLPAGTTSGLDFFEKWIDTRKMTDDKRVTLPAGMLIQALQVCQNDPSNADERELKGLRIWGNAIGSDGKIGSVSGAISHPDIITSNGAEGKRTNCKNWDAVASCGNNEIVVGLKPFWTSKGLQSIGIMCRQLYVDDSPPVIMFPPPTINGTYDGTKIVTSAFNLTLMSNWPFGSATGGVHLNNHETPSFGSATPFSNVAVGGSVSITRTSAPVSWAALGCNAMATSCDTKIHVRSYASNTAEGTFEDHNVITLHLTRTPGAGGK